MAVSFQCVTKSTTIKKNNNNKNFFKKYMSHLWEGRVIPQCCLKVTIHFLIAVIGVRALLSNRTFCFDKGCFISDLTMHQLYKVIELPYVASTDEEMNTLNISSSVPFF